MHILHAKAYASFECARQCTTPTLYWAQVIGHNGWLRLIAPTAVANDTRITKVGGVLRKYRIDELPQLLNVLKGEMSLVGPRPERPEFVGELGVKIPYYDKRHQVKPGVTGWAQINYPYGASDEDARQKLQYDLYYAKNNSLFMDILVIIRTVETILYDGQ